MSPAGPAARGHRTSRSIDFQFHQLALWAYKCPTPALQAASARLRASRLGGGAQGRSGVHERLQARGWSGATRIRSVSGAERPRAVMVPLSRFRLNGSDVPSKTTHVCCPAVNPESG